MPPFLFGAAMRYLLLLLLFPSLSYAGCHPGVNYGQYPITAGNPVCAPYSGSSLGGCFAYCGGASENTLCVEFPLASPPTKGPYTTNGNECQYYTGSDSNSSGNSGGNNGGTDGTNQNPNGLVDVGTIIVGDKYVTDFGKGFNVLANNVNQSASKVQKSVSDLAKQLDNAMDSNNARYMDPFLSNLSRIAQNTSGISGGGASTVDYEMAWYLKSLSEKSVFDPSFWNAKDIARTKQLSDMRQDISYLGGELQYITDILRSGGGSSGGGSGGGELAAIQAMMQSNMSTMGSISGNTKSMDSNLRNMSGELGSIGSTLRTMNSTNSSQLGDMQGSLAAIKGMTQQALQSGWGNSGGGQGGGDGDGDGGEGGDKPCTGPLCSFNKPSSSSGSALSKVFSTESIDDVKKQIENKDTEISDAMNDIKSVFAPEELTITGTYNNDYHDINGVRVDLSGKSNLELFFNSGPKMAIWFLAVLLAFSILMGGRKNA